MVKTLGDLALLFIAGVVIYAIEVAITMWYEARQAKREAQQVQEGEWE